MLRHAALPFLVVCACSDDGASSTPSECPGVELLVAASDYESSVACGAPGCFEETGKTTARELGVDPHLVSDRGETFFLARQEDFIWSINPSCGTPTTKIDVTSFKVPPAGYANPQDVAVAADGTLFVPFYNVPILAFIENGVVGPKLDLSSFDEDGNPQATSVRIVNDKAFVALEILDDHSEPPLQSTRPSKMLRIDTATRAVEATIELAGRNPFNTMAELGTVLYLAEPNNTRVADEEFGGIERFDTVTSTTELLVRERDLGGSVMEVAVTAGCGAAIVAAPGQLNPTALVTFDPDNGKIFHTFSTPVLGPTPGFDLAGLVWRGDKLYVGDRHKGGNGQYPVHELARSGGCELVPTGNTIDVPQPPVGLQAAKQ